MITVEERAIQIGTVCQPLASFPKSQRAPMVVALSAIFFGAVDRSSAGSLPSKAFSFKD
jgi:hypothetical protein